MNGCRRRLLCTSGLAGVALLGLAGRSFAADQTYQFDIPAESLGQALTDFSRFSSQQIVFSEKLTGSIKASGLHGQFTVAQGLSALLANTGLRAESNTTGVLMIQPEKIQFAQNDSQPATDGSPGGAVDAGAAPETVEVTGTLFNNPDYRAPTPVTSVTTADLLRQTPEGIAVALDQLPQFQASTGPNNYGTQAGTPGAGDYLNLRGLGALETLTLLDGDRLVSTSFNGTVDANIIPEAFIQRVDVVTAGASATYGSDAVTGVVNYITNTKFNGLKGSIQGGISDFGDDSELKTNIAVGADLFGGRGHIEASYDHFFQPGITCVRAVAGDCSRPNAFGFGIVGTGTAASPYLLGSNLTVSNSTYGTLITSALNSTGKTVPFTYNNYTFLPGGVATPFNAGTPTTTVGISSGGAGAVTFGTSLTAKDVTDHLFSRFDYDLTSDIHSYAQLMYTDDANAYVTVADGSQVNAFHIFQDNAYLPAAISQAMVAQGVSEFVGSRYEGDQTPKLTKTNTAVWAGKVGLDGKIFGNWAWKADYSYGDSQLRTDQAGNFNQARWYAALDAVVNPANGSIVCRVTLTNPGLYPGCLPWNPFGNGSPSEAAYAYIEGTEQFQVNNRLHDATAKLSGDLFDLPAGPLSVAVSAEYRYEMLNETAVTNPGTVIDQTGLCHAVSANGAPTGAPVTSAQCNAAVMATGIVNSTTSPSVLQFSTTNVGPSKGNEGIAEGAVEFAVPILKDLPYIEDLDLDLGYRFAQYSISGSAQTWKLGGSYVPIDELRIRGTMSRDFRAPNLYELFAGASATFGNFNDSIHSGTSAYLNTYSVGNPLLKPEIGQTSTMGAVWTPDYVPGFSAALDYYTVSIDNEIAKLSSSNVDTLCQESNGTSPLCAYIVRPTAFSNMTTASFPTYIDTIPINQGYVRQAGFDLDTTYNLALNNLFPDWTSSLDFRFIGNYTASILTFAGLGSPVLQSAGAGGTPKIKFNFSTTYLDGPIDLGFRIRYIGRDLSPFFHPVEDRA